MPFPSEPPHTRCQCRAFVALSRQIDAARGDVPGTNRPQPSASEESVTGRKSLASRGPGLGQLHSVVKLVDQTGLLRG